MNTKTQKAVKNILLAFVLITIGFALGKESAKRHFVTSGQSDTSAGKTHLSAGESTESKVVVYYAHTTFRCVTCNTIEEMAKATISNAFSNELTNGVVEWRTVNFQTDEKFASRYEIVSSCVVVVGMNGAVETGYKRLDDVWTKVKEPEAFIEYVTDAVLKYLPAKKGGAK